MFNYVSESLVNPTPGSFVQVQGINSHDDIVGRAGNDGVVWKHSGAVQIVPQGILAGNSNPGSVLWAINDSQVAVGLLGMEISFLFHSNNGTVKLLNHGTLHNAFATDINNVGVVCGSFIGSPNGFIYDSFSDNVLNLVSPPSGWAECDFQAINNSMPYALAGMTQIGGESHGFVYRDGSFWELGPIHYVSDINDSGLVVGSIVDPTDSSNALAVSWNIAGVSPGPVQPKAIPLPLLPGVASGPYVGGLASGVNNAGAIVGSCGQKGFPLLSAFIYDGNASDQIALPRYPVFLTKAVLINDRSTIVGNDYDVSFRLIAYRLPAWLRNSIALFPVGPGWTNRDPKKHDILIGLELDELAKHILDPAARASLRTSILSGVETGVKQLMQNISDPVHVPMAYGTTGRDDLRKNDVLRQLRQAQQHG